KKEMREDDKGYVSAQKVSDDWVNYAQTGQRVKRRPDTVLLRVIILFFAIIAFHTMANMVGVMLAINGIGTLVMWYVVFAILLVGIAAVYLRKRLGDQMKGMIPVLIKPILAILLALVILIWHPVSDLYYYGGAIVSMAAVIWTLMDIIGRYNVLTTRKLPQFNRRGGDHYA
ncbi:MAG: hypothetical protein HDR28_03155, partial [Lachnospiraceae bacterium]|nr:hypothetical protein [Lachnospiraceae bacterium]